MYVASVVEEDSSKALPSASGICISYSQLCVLPAVDCSKTSIIPSAIYIVQITTTGTRGTSAESPAARKLLATSLSVKYVVKSDNGSVKSAMGTGNTSALLGRFILLQLLTAVS